MANSPASEPVQASKTENVNFAPGGTIRVDNSYGSLTVEGWDQPEVEVTVVRSLGFVSEPKATEQRRLDAVQVATERKSDSELAIRTTPAPQGLLGYLHLKARDVVLEYRIRVPRNSNLVIHHSGYIAVTNVTGNIDASDGRGDIVLMLPDLATYSIDAHTKLGVVSSDKPATQASADSGGSARGRQLKLRMGFGGITIKELPREALASEVK